MNLIWVGPIIDSSGYGAVSRNYIRVLAKMGQRIAFIPFGPDQASTLSEVEINELIKLPLVNEFSGSKVQIFYNTTGNSLLSMKSYVFEVLKELNITVTKEIAVSIFETDSLPQLWVSQLNQFDEIWIPTDFNKETFLSSGVKPEKLTIVPYPVDCDYFYPDETIAESAVNRFLYVFSFGFRKGLDLLLDAFCQEFTKDDDVELYLKITNSANQDVGSYVKDFLQKRFGFRHLSNLPFIDLNIGTIKVSDLRDLYRSSFLYVSTDRANGWGMPVVESMACGVPAAAIDWSGGTQFLNSHNGYPIPTTGHLELCDGRLVDYEDSYRQQHWAEVTTSAVRNTLRSSLEDSQRPLRRQKALDTAKTLSFEAVGQLISKIL